MSFVGILATVYKNDAGAHVGDAYMSRKIESWPNSTFSLDVEDGPRVQGQFRKAVLERALDILRQAGVSQDEASCFMRKIMEFYPVGNPKEYLKLLRRSLMAACLRFACWHGNQRPRH